MMERVGNTVDSANSVQATPAGWFTADMEDHNN